MSTQEDGPASAAPPPPEVIDTTQDGCAGPAAARMDRSSSSGSSRCSGSSGTSGGSGSSHGLVGPASASPAASPVVGRGALSSWTVGKSSPQAIDVFFKASMPKLRQRARSRVCTRRSPDTPESQAGGSNKRSQGARGKQQNNAKNVPVTERVCQFPGQGFMVSNRKFFCQLCAKELSNDKDTCKFHIGQSVIIVYLIVANLDRQTSTILSWRSGR